MHIIIVGAGLVGMAQAIVLAQNAIKVSLIESRTLSGDDDQHNGDERTTFVTWASWIFLKDLGIELEQYTPVNHLSITDSQGVWGVHYEGIKSFGHPMGYIVPNVHLKRQFFKRIKQLPICIIDEARIEQCTYEDYETTLYVQTPYQKKSIAGQLLICAQGRDASLRDTTSIRTQTWDFGQSALVAHVTHSNDHGFRAYEMFTPHGPLALLPLAKSNEEEIFRSAIVWCKEKNFSWHHYSNEQLCHELQTLFPFYGAFNSICNRQVYALKGLSVNRLTHHRFALIGDAAHVLHPIAGQGVNLGWNDVKILSDVIIKNHELGLDTGLEFYLKPYELQRRRHLFFKQSTTFILRFFCSSNKIFSYVRRGAFGVLDRLTYIKNKIVKIAMGV